MPIKRRSMFNRMETEFRDYPTYAEYQEPIRYEVPMTGEQVISFRRRWSTPLQAIRQPDLAAWLGLNPRQISRYESNESPVPPPVVLALCELERRLVERAERRARDSVVAPPSSETEELHP